jgi:hypothetical protein
MVSVYVATRSRLDSCRVEEVDHPLGLWEAAVAEILLPATQRAVTCTEIVYNMIR